MSPQLRKTVQDFLLQYQDSDFDNWATTDLLLETAADLLRQCVAEDCKIPPDED